MQIIKLTNNDIDYLESEHKSLTYNRIKNVIEGTLSFNLKFSDEKAIEDKYQIEIELNKVSELGLPIVRETDGRILKIAQKKKLFFGDLHINNTEGELCMILPPKVKERYPNGFELKTLIEHIQEHLYWVSYFEKYNKKPWKEYGHGELGYLELYIENKELYAVDVKRYFGNLNRHAFRKKIKELRKKYKT